MEEDEGTHICGRCDREFNFVRHVEVTYSTTKIDCGDDKHEYEREYHHIKKQNFIDGKWIDIPEEEWKYHRVDKCINCDDKRFVNLGKEEYFTQVDWMKLTLNQRRIKLGYKPIETI